MKKSVTIMNAGILLILSITVVGCGSKIPELSAEDEAAVVQYMADSLIRHNEGYEATVLNQEEIAQEENRRKLAAEELQRQKEEEERRASEEAEQQKADDIEVIGDADGGGSKALRDFSEFSKYLELDGVEIAYTGYELTDSYPKSGDDMYFAVSAKEGHQLMVLKLTLHNTSDNALMVDIGAKGNKYRFSVNDEKYTSMLLTLLEDDFSTFSGEIASDASVELVMIAEVNDISSVDSLSMQAIKPDKTKASFLLE